MSKPLVSPTCASIAARTLPLICALAACDAPADATRASATAELSRAATAQVSCEGVPAYANKAAPGYPAGFSAQSAGKLYQCLYSGGWCGMAVYAPETGWAWSYGWKLLGTCAPSGGPCAGQPDGAPCDDGNACTAGDACAAGSCNAGAPIVCAAADACHDAGVCNPSTGQCSTPAPRRCDDANLCTDDACDPSAGCVFTANTAPCSDGDACTIGDTCAGGRCAGGPASSCAAGCPAALACDGLACGATNACGASCGDACDAGCPAAGTAACADPCGGVPAYADKATPGYPAGYRASYDGQIYECRYSGGWCGMSAYAPVTGWAWAHAWRLVGSCAPADPCAGRADGTACDDGDACTVGDACVAGACTGGAPASCDDGSACTVDLCVAPGGCTHTPIACDDADPCTLDSCGTAGCAHTPRSCDDANPCTADACAPASGCTNTPAVGPCDDGDACTLADTCEAGACTGTLASCAEGCPATGDCEGLGCGEPNACGAICGSTCDAGCEGASAPACADDCAGLPIYADAYLGYRAGDRVQSGGKAYACLVYGWCGQSAYAPGTGWAWANAWRLVGPCGGGPCVGRPDGTACDDGNACTTGDTCTGGTCGGAATPCFDGKECTTDACHPTAGCTFTSIPGCTPSYLCDESNCAPPDCRCASPVPPGDLDPATMPQLITLTFDDAITTVTHPAAVAAMTDPVTGARFVNPNGCPMGATWYVSTNYTEMDLARQLYEQGHEIAIHTINHNVGTAAEIDGARALLAAQAGIPEVAMRGYRAPYLRSEDQSFQALLDFRERTRAAAPDLFVYDSSITEQPGLFSGSVRSLIWPYTLDYVGAQPCWVGTCATRPYPGVWEIPMWVLSTASGGTYASMDPPGDAASLLGLFKQNFLNRYEGNRAPLGIFLHPAWLLSSPDHLEALVEFFAWAEAYGRAQHPPHGDVWFVTSTQLIELVRSPQDRDAALGFAAFGCPPR